MNKTKQTINVIIIKTLIIQSSSSSLSSYLWIIYNWRNDQVDADDQHNHRDDDWALKIFHLNKLSSDYNDDSDDDDYDYDDVNDNQLSL